MDSDKNLKLLLLLISHDRQTSMKTSQRANRAATSQKKAKEGEGVKTQPNVKSVNYADP